MCVVRVRVVRVRVVVVANVQLPATVLLALSPSLMVWLEMLVPSVPAAAAAWAVFGLTFRFGSVTVPSPLLIICCVAAEETVEMPGGG